MRLDTNIHVGKDTPIGIGYIRESLHQVGEKRQMAWLGQAPKFVVDLVTISVKAGGIDEPRRERYLLITMPGRHELDLRDTYGHLLCVQHGLQRNGLGDVQVGRMGPRGQLDCVDHVHDLHLQWVLA